MKAKRRHELKEDAFVAFVSSAWGTVKNHARPIIIIAAVVVVAGSVVAIASVAKMNLRQRAGDIFANALHVPGGELMEPADVRDKKIEQLEAAEDALADTAVEPTFLMELGMLLLEKDDPDSIVEARRALDALLLKYPDFEFAVFARLTRGKTLFALGEFGQAAEDFKEVYRQAASESGGPAKDLGGQAKWLEGRCYEEMGDLERAEGAYSTCINTSRASRWTLNAETDLRNLRAAWPSTTFQAQLDATADDEATSTEDTPQ